VSEVEAGRIADEARDDGRSERRKLLEDRGIDDLDTGVRLEVLGLEGAWQEVVDRVELPERNAGRRRCVDWPDGNAGVGLL
jgi:hypothetical protein